MDHKLVWAESKYNAYNTKKFGSFASYTNFYG